MGDNANQTWSWHNNEVGQGYQAKGVIRQNVGEKQSMKILDMTVKAEDNNDNKKEHKASKSHKKHKKEKSHKDKKEKDKKHKKEKRSKRKEDKEDKDNFNPLLQLLATRLSNTTRFFSCEGYP